MDIISSSRDKPQSATGGFRVDVGRGQQIGRVSSEWFSRPDDERYFSLTELYGAVKARADRARRPARWKAAPCAWRRTGRTRRGWR